MTENGRGWSAVALPAGQPAPVGAYSPVVRAGDFVYVSGQVPRDPVTGALQGDDVAAQTRSVLSNVARVLGYAGATLSDLVAVTAYLERIEDWDAFNRVYREHFIAPFPTRTTLGAQLHGVLVEISGVAYVPVGRGGS
jgi:2-iminobutanoate/2-iminopropanoate deaminase